jgi:hypothetical protein
MNKALLSNIYFVGSKPDISGFPKLHHFSYSGSIFYEQYELLIPMIKAKGYIFNKPLVINFPNGLVINGTQMPALYSLDRLFFITTLPKEIPEHLHPSDLTLWQEQGHKIHFDDILLLKNNLTISGTGNVSLDKNLQPLATFTLTLSGADIFAEWLEELDVISSVEENIFQALYQSMKKKNPDTGEEEMTIELEIKNQMLFFGPLQVASLPEIEWDKRNQLDQPQ